MYSPFSGKEEGDGAEYGGRREREEKSLEL